MCTTERGAGCQEYQGRMPRTAAQKTEESTMMEFTTIEKLQMKVSANYGSVLKFGDHVLVTDAYY